MHTLRKTVKRIMRVVSTERPMGLPGELAEVQAWLREVEVDRLLGRVA